MMFEPTRRDFKQRNAEDTPTCILYLGDLQERETAV